jgi:indolepyruvate ferredoxin oxidoreductase alpha subunit
MGASTFFHSGMTGAAEIIYNQGKMIPCILDNSITGITGHQDNPGSGVNLMGEPAPLIRIEKVLEAYGYEKIIIVDPQDLAAMEQAVQDALASAVPAAIIARRPCLLIKKIKHDIGKCAVNPDQCRGCKKCLTVGCPAVCMQDGKATIDETLCVGCTVCAQVCPFGAIERVGEK